MARGVTESPCSVTDLKNGLSRYLRLVKQGEIIEILDHSVPVARLHGLPELLANEEELESLIRDGILSQAPGRPRLDLLTEPPVPCRGDVAKVLIEERGDR